ncbi:Ribosome biogenesis protein erb1 [Glutinoglossum americanum]|uniref:Ribosome biogenesis protein ERB1 n=1 Tax=Glutinoglossum americanum TaxID=1670608 RepID=A0A9P8KUP4_9PEZI|nr:Ribosome biogenesis protein erb1 [Glutinoglossum americanum]
MTAPLQSKKRKAVTRDVPDVGSDVSDDEFQTGLLEGILSQSESDSEDETDEEDGSELDEDAEDDIDSDEIPDEDEEEADSGLKLVNGGKISSAITRKENNNDTEDAGFSEENEEPNYTVTEDANGNPRYIYKEIDPVYDSDDTDAQETTNTIGNIPLSFYDSYPHIGYDINGKKVMRPAKGEALDALLDSIEVPKGWTGLTDPNTGKPLELSRDEMEILRRIQMDEIPEDGYDPYPATIEYFTSKTEIMPLSAAPEPKRRFIPSKHEAKRVMKIVRAIREGRILPYKPPSTEDKESTTKYYDIWANEKPRSDHIMNIPAPKLPPPTHDQSYNPPPEYLPSKSEKKAWEEADDEDREKEYLPTKHDALRKVPGYDRFVKERFERCLDLYLAPRIRRNKLNIDPESLLPKLPSPEELRPFPTTCATLYRGHEGRVRSLAIDPTGTWLASGGDDGTVRIWELLSGRQIWSMKIDDEAVNVVRWRPGKDAVIISAAAGESIFLIIPPIVDPETETTSRDILDAGWGYAAKSTNTTASASVKKEPPAKWTRPGTLLEDGGVLVKATVRSTIKVISWHRRGDYFATVSPTGQNSAVAIHTLSKHLTQLPFRHLRGLAQTALFHPSRPILFVATQRTIRSYDLVRQTLLKTLSPGARWISSLDLHPAGDNLIVGSYDRRLLWHDLDLSTRPYKTLRYHSKAIRAVRFHQGGLPLFASASDDGSVQVFHGKVVADLMENATIVPLKVLKGHAVRKELGVLDVEWHPREAWCVSAVPITPASPYPLCYLTSPSRLVRPLATLEHLRQPPQQLRAPAAPHELRHYGSLTSHTPPISEFHHSSGHLFFTRNHENHSTSPAAHPSPAPDLAILQSLLQAALAQGTVPLEKEIRVREELASLLVVEYERGAACWIRRVRAGYLPLPPPAYGGGEYDSCVCGGCVLGFGFRAREARVGEGGFGC